MTGRELAKRVIIAALPTSVVNRLRSSVAAARENKARRLGAIGAISLRQFAQTRGAAPSDPVTSPLEMYFDSHVEGHGIWKWRHYFEAYHRHLSKFIGRRPRIIEIGVYSGGSLGMWRDYFGEGCTVIGVDIEPACREYAGDGIEIHIGDQADPGFWKRFLSEVAPVDVVIDDGGHEFAQQRETLVQLLPHLRQGGVYICEDVHGAGNRLLPYIEGFTRSLHDLGGAAEGVHHAGEFQQSISSVHLYPFMLVIERTRNVMTGFSAPKRGTRWKPFFDR